MKKWILPPLALASTACMPAEPIEMTAAEQGEFSKAVTDRVAGSPLNCVSSRSLRGNRSFGEGVILFEGHGGTVYVNRPAAGCPELGLGRSLVTRSSGTQLCQGDIAEVVDLSSGVGFGGCALGEFVPYRRARYRL
jgi:hypothetical protein